MAYSHGTGGHVLASTIHGIAWHGMALQHLLRVMRSPEHCGILRGVQASRWHLHNHLLSGMHCMGVRGSIA